MLEAFVNRSFVHEKDFQELFVSYYSALSSFACRYIDSKVVAEDLVQDVFVKLWEKREELSKVENISAYLYQMVRFRCFNYLKEIKIQDGVFSVLQKEVKVEVDDMEAYMLEETYRLLELALKELPPVCGKIFSMTLEGYTAKEIAEELDIVEGTVKKQKQIARGILREKLGKILLIVPII